MNIITGWVLIYYLPICLLFVLSVVLVLKFFPVFFSIWILEAPYWVLWKIPVKIYIVIYRSIWSCLISIYYWVLQSRSIVYKLPLLRFYLTIFYWNFIILHERRLIVRLIPHHSIYFYYHYKIVFLKNYFLKLIVTDF